MHSGCPLKGQTFGSRPSKLSQQDQAERLSTTYTDTSAPAQVGSASRCGMETPDLTITMDIGTVHQILIYYNEHVRSTSGNAVHL